MQYTPYSTDCTVSNLNLIGAKVFASTDIIL